MKIFHCLIIEGDEKSASSKSLDICNEILGDEFKKKIKNKICSDVIFVKTKDNKNSIGVDEIRKIKKDVFLKPVECNSKIYIIKNAQLMTEQAQNALLKIIEEPPSYVYFILLCDNSNKLLKTVVSRAQILNVSNDQKNKNSEIYESLLELILKDDRYEILKILDSFCNKREKLVNFFEGFKIHVIGNFEKIPRDLCIKIFEKLDKCIEYTKCNVNMNLISCYFCIIER